MPKKRNAPVKRPATGDKKPTAGTAKAKGSVPASASSNAEGSLEHPDEPETDDPDGDSAGSLTATERKVLVTFRKYLMTPGQMLCFNPQEQGSLKKGLESLLERGFISAEATTGAFSLTSLGYTAMKEST